MSKCVERVEQAHFGSCHHTSLIYAEVCGRCTVYNLRDPFNLPPLPRTASPRWVAVVHGVALLYEVKTSKQLRRKARARIHID